MNEKSQAPMNAAELAKYEAAIRESLQQAISSMQLRKWSMEQALGIFTSSNISGPAADIIATAQAIYDFTAQPAIILMNRQNSA
jgi:hypothetical protein